MNGTPAAAQQRSGANGQLISNNQAAPPQCDANCVRANAAKAADACAPRIESQAPSSFNWMSRPNAGIFQQADPSSPGDTIVRYRGDSIRFLTADKSWLRVSYECAYDVRAGVVQFVKVRSGSLDQPLGPANVQNSKPTFRGSGRGARGRNSRRGAGRGDHQFGVGQAEKTGTCLGAEPGRNSATEPQSEAASAFNLGAASGYSKPPTDERACEPLRISGRA